MKHIYRFCLLLTVMFLSTPAVLAQDIETDPSTGSNLIAYIGVDANVYTFDTVNNTRNQLTDDASDTKFYQWPTWATDGRLAFFGVTLDENGEFTTDVLVSPDGAEKGELVYTGANEAFNYAYWSPRNCLLDTTCRDLAILFSSQEAGGLFVELIRDSQEPSSIRLGTGGPFYYSWSPDGNQMLWQRNNQRLDIYDVTEEEIIDTLEISPGLFQAPSWSPVDDRLLFGTLGENGESTNLVIQANNELRVLAEGLTGAVSFAWSPDGNYVAYRTVERDRIGALFILDAITGEVAAQSNVSGVIAFFWSPNSEHIAYLTLATPPGSFNAKPVGGQQPLRLAQAASGLAWSVLDVDDGSIRRYGSFMPTQEMVYMLRFFDQFAQSHRIWSPDSRHLVYGEVTADDRSIISLVDTTLSNTVPFSIGEGQIGVWSFD
jgi:TolB protein